MKNKNQLSHAAFERGFTLIELLVVIAIIGLLASVIMVSVYSARSKARDVRRAGDMTQMFTALEAYNTSHRGYPAATNVSQPENMVPNFVAQVPVSPLPTDSPCDTLVYPNGQPASSGYYYVASGSPSTYGGLTVYPDYIYYFCLSSKVGSIEPGVHYLTPRGMR
jgi:prepilin-type N-terminal cleavage/methylation domain-containing protein